MKAADIALRTAPPHTFDLGPGAWATSWEQRPVAPITVGLRRVCGHERSQANVEAIARADRAFKAKGLDARCHDGDPLWLRTWEMAFIHYLLGYALCHPQDVTRGMWPDQDGDMLLVDPDDREGKPGDIPIVSRRFSDAGIVRCYDELEILERKSEVNRRRALDGEVRRFGAELADGSLLAALRAHPSDDARAVDAHLRILLAQAIDLVSTGRETPHPAAT